MTIVLAWVIAQVIKFLLYYLVNKKLDFDRLLGDGGMPSSHSAVVTSCATFALLEYGANSFEFTIAAVLAIIVMHDAMGVRRQTGKQAEFLNEISALFEDIEGYPTLDGKLKILVGHTFPQVIVGGVIGIFVAELVWQMYI